MWDKKFRHTRIVLNEKNIEILRLLSKALECAQMDTSRFFPPTTTSRTKHHELPAMTIACDIEAHDEVYMRVLTPACSTLYSLKGKHVKEEEKNYWEANKWGHVVPREYKSRFLVVKEILSRLLSLICARDAISEKWANVYIAFAKSITQSELLFHKHGMFSSSRRPTELHKTLCSQEINDLIAKRAKHLDMMFMKTDQLPEEERNRVEQYRDIVSFEAFGRLIGLARELQRMEPDLPPIFNPHVLTELLIVGVNSQDSESTDEVSHRVF